MPKIIFEFSAGFALLVTIASPTSAAIRPSFYLDYSVWKATHIVLTTEGDLIDGRLTVIESWKGDLEPDTDIILPELADFADAKSRRVRDWWQRRDLPEPYARVVSGSRMVLFLIESEATEQTTSSDSKPRAWLPASYYGRGGFKVSVAWLEQGEAYAFLQVSNPGPSVLTHLGTAIEMKARVVVFDVIQANLGKAVDDRDPVLAAQSLRAFHRQEFHYGAKASIESLGRMGGIALPTLRRLLGDITLYHWHPDIISSLVAAGGVDVAPDLTAIVKEGLAFWQERLPKLKKDWWNSAPDNQRRGLRNKYKRLLAALRALRHLRYAPCRDVVSAVHDLWQSDDTLSDVGNSQMTRACDAVLKGLAGEPEAP
jgi:hypothetical protein